MSSGQERVLRQRHYIRKSAERINKQPNCANQDKLDATKLTHPVKDVVFAPSLRSLFLIEHQHYRINQINISLVFIASHLMAHIIELPCLWLVIQQCI